MTPLAKLDELAALEPNWDSYGAKAMHPAVIEAVRGFLEWLAANHADLPQPRVIPIVDGGVSVHWGCSGGLDIDFDFEVDQSDPPVIARLYILDGSDRFEATVLAHDCDHCRSRVVEGVRRHLG